jgi:hypothetical protein
MYLPTRKLPLKGLPGIQIMDGYQPGKVSDLKEDYE